MEALIAERSLFTQCLQRASCLEAERLHVCSLLLQFEASLMGPGVLQCVFLYHLLTQICFRGKKRKINATLLGTPVQQHQVFVEKTPKKVRERLVSCGLYEPPKVEII